MLFQNAVRLFDIGTVSGQKTGQLFRLQILKPLLRLFRSRFDDSPDRAHQKVECGGIGQSHPLLQPRSGTRNPLLFLPPHHCLKLKPGVKNKPGPEQNQKQRKQNAPGPDRMPGQKTFYLKKSHDSSALPQERRYTGKAVLPIRANRIDACFG